MHYFDWSIVIGLLALMTATAIYTRRYTKSVAGFLAAERSAGRYLLCVCDGMSALGAITIVMMFEMYYEAGFPVIWWDMFRAMIIPTVLSLSGWIIYRFRQTRALTMAQFFEMRYSRNFRIFCGILIWVSGIINFGIFPAVGARFFIHFMGVPETTLVYAIFMAVLLGFALFFTFMGGQVAVMVTDFIQGIFCNIMFIIIVVAAFAMFKWPDIVATLTQASQKASMVHPFKVSQAENFNTWFYVMLALYASYVFMTWQGTQGYNAAAINAHEARMGKSLSVWRLMMQNVFVVTLPICAFTFLNNPDYAQQAAAAKGAIAAIVDPTIRGQVTTTVALKYFLPVGIMGGLAAVMLSAFIGNHDTYMHSWGSIFVQDVILPFRKKPLSPKQHMRWLKMSILGVAIFIFLFSLYFRQSERIIMFFMITGSIFCGGAGSVLIGGLYWKRGTTQGAWAGMITGSTLAVTFIILKQIHLRHPFENDVLLFIVSKSGMFLSFSAAIFAIIAYVTGSLLTWGQVCDFDKLFNQGKYALQQDATAVDTQKISGFRRLIGMNADFNRKDKIIYSMLLVWTFGLVVMFGVLTAVNFIHELPDGFWIGFWKYYLIVFFSIGTVVTVWFTIGGIMDMKRMFRKLSEQTCSNMDDGRVVESYQENQKEAHAGSDALK